MIELFGDWSEHVRALMELADKVMVDITSSIPPSSFPKTLRFWVRC